MAPALIPLVSDDPAVEAAVRLALPAATRLEVFPLDGITDARHELSDRGRRVVEAAQAAGLVLVTWRLECGPVLNTLGHHVRRAAAGPVIALCRTAADGPAALAACADAVATFPLHFPLLQANAAAYRRLVLVVSSRPSAPGPAQHDVLHLPPFELDRTAHRCRVHGREVELTPREFALLDHLLTHAGALRTRDQILDAVWGIDFDTGTNMVDVYTHFLRRKLEAHGVRDVIETVRGRGYRLTLPEPA